jgi:hypothetical protein
MSGDADHGARRLVLMHGREQARRMVEPDRRALVDIAAEVLADDAGRIGITYTGFCLTGLPHRRLPENEPWQRRGHRVTLLVEPGHLQRGPKEAPRLYGVPYGARARMILLYLQTQAVRTGSREVELGRSMRAWLGSMGLSIGGKTYKQVTDQAHRISGCTLTFYADRQGTELMRRAGFVDGAINLTDIGEQPSLWQERVLLNEEFFRALREHPVPLSEAALRAIGPRSMVIDTYIWLAYRLHALKRDVEVGWPALYAQFGAGYGQIRFFRRHFIECIALATAAYPEARVDLSDRGLILRPSRPAVPKIA